MSAIPLIRLPERIHSDMIRMKLKSKAYQQSVNTINLDLIKNTAKTPISEL